MRTHQRQLRALNRQPANGRLDSPYLSAEEAARYLHYGSVKSLYNAIAGGVTNRVGEVIPSLRRGRTFLFDPRELDVWLHDGKVAAFAPSLKGRAS